jgi:hypothetical protein
VKLAFVCFVVCCLQVVANFCFYIRRLLRAAAFCVGRMFRGVAVLAQVL